MEHKEQTLKYLSGLLYLGIATLSLDVLGDLLRNDLLANWPQALVTAATVVCLYRLRPANSRYRVSALIRAVVLALSLIPLVINTFFLPELIGTPVFTAYLSHFLRFVSVIMIIGSAADLWFEYSAHGTLIPEQKKKWWILYFLRLAAVAFYSVGTYLTAMVNWPSVSVYGLWLALLQLPGKALTILYLLFLYKTIRLVREEKGVNYGEDR